jgi:prephenate dehydrogenase
LLRLWGVRSRSRPPPLRSLGRVGVAGPGLIGGSIALRARALGLAVTGWDIDEANLRRALDRGALSARARSFRELAAGSDVLVLAAPLEAILAQVVELASVEPPPALTLDVASVMAPVARAGRELPGFAATHPIAGSERAGVAAAREDLFAGKVWAYDATADRATIALLEVFLAGMGAQPLPIDPLEHDRVIALTSHLPQLLSVALGRHLNPSLSSAAVSALCGTGMASMLRLGASSWPMWRSILGANAEPVAQEVRELAAVLLGFAGALERGASDSLETDFLAAADAAARLEENVAARAGVHEARPDFDER